MVQAWNLNTLKKNGKFFVAPVRDDRDFKELFKHLADMGAGRPLDQDGAPVGPWTPELLTRAISQIRSNPGGIEVRTVQYWFQENDRNVSSDSIRWLARIFGCNDPVATAEWQAELSAANRRLKEKRKNRQLDTHDPLEQAPTSPLNPINEIAPTPAESDSKRHFDLARRTESLFCGSPLNLPASVFAGAVALGFASHFLGNHEVTFDISDGHTKQVGFLWAPNWTILFMAFMPLFFSVVSELLFFWKDEGRQRVTPRSGRDQNVNTSWEGNIEASVFTFRAILLICLFFVGAFQWVGVRLLPLLRGGGDYATDWGSLALVRPEVISVPEAIAFTGFAYLYMCVCFYLFFAALVLLYSIAQDFGKVRASSRAEQDMENQNETSMVGARVMQGIFRCTVLAIFVAVCMKLQSTYLASGGTDILRWLTSDMVSALNATSRPERLGDYSAPNHFSSLLIVLAAIFVFLHGVSRLDVGSRNRIALWMMVTTVGLLVAGYLLIGAFAGFSVLLGIAFLIATYGLFDPGYRTAKCAN